MKHFLNSSEPVAKVISINYGPSKFFWGLDRTFFLYHVVAWDVGQVNIFSTLHWFKRAASRRCIIYLITNKSNYGGERIGRVFFPCFRGCVVMRRGRQNRIQNFKGDIIDMDFFYYCIENLIFDKHVISALVHCYVAACSISLSIPFVSGEMSERFLVEVRQTNIFT